MGVSTIRVNPESLLEVISLLKLLDIRVTGSCHSDDYMEFGLLIEGPSVPESNRVHATIHKSHDDRSSKLEVTFEECGQEPQQVCEPSSQSFNISGNFNITGRDRTEYHWHKFVSYCTGATTSPSCR
jgi:hypothetical protein